MTRTSIPFATRLCAAAFLAALWLPPSAAQAASINVPGDYPTIQAAIEAAAAGDTVVVAPGTYLENVDFKGKAVTVESAQGPSVTVIDGGGLAPVVTFADGETPSSAIQGFTIQHGFASFMGAGVYISNASPTVAGNVISWNTACGSGAGVSVYFGSPVIRDNTISNNSKQAGCSGDDGGGLNLQGAGSAQVVHNQISQNSSDFGGGIALFAAGTPTLRDNTISGNSASIQGGGVYAVNQSDANLVQNLITDNTAGSGGGLYISPPSGTRGALLVNNTLSGNSASDSGVLLGGFDAQVELANNVISGPASQPAVLCDTTYSATPPVFDHNLVYNATNSPLHGSCTGVVGTNGNLSADPLFISSTDFHLQATSSAIDAGDSAAPALPNADLDGKPRISGAAVDGGVYEVQQALDLVMSSVGGLVEGAASALVLGHIGGGIQPYAATVSWGDGTSSPAQISAANGYAVYATHAFADEGTYTIAVTVTDATGASVGGTTPASVADAALTLTGTSLAEPRRATFSATVAGLVDANPGASASDFSGQIAWGDGTTSACPSATCAIVAQAGGGFGVTGTHSYRSKGTYSVTVQVADVGGSKASASTAVKVS